jgi:predicted Zn-dependent peptidase
MIYNRIAHLAVASAICISGLSTVSGAWAEQLPKPLIPVTKDFKLPNGLRVILSEDHTVPVVSTVLIYDVGSQNEKKGRSGFAHLFEHMMFEGSENVGKTEHFKFIESAGGSTNASTRPDFTDYYDKVPSNQAELILWLEADRMRSLKVTPENFKNQLETVKEEKRSRIDNQPYTPATIKLDEMVFDNWSNAHPTIGSFEDLEASSIEDVRNFFKTYYAPNNAIMAIVGDFDAREMQKLVEKHFSSILRHSDPPRPDLAEPEQKEPKYLKMPDRHAKIPAFIMGWKSPPRRDPDYYPLLILEKVLSSGDSSRFYQQLVKGSQVALRADAGMDQRRGPSGFQTFVMYKPGNTAEKVRELVWAELEKLHKEPVSAQELEKARNQVLRGFFGSGYSSLQRSLGRAQLLAQYGLFYGDPHKLDEDLDAVMKVTPQDVQRVAKKVLTRQAVSVIDIEPTESKPKEKAMN